MSLNWEWGDPLSQISGDEEPLLSCNLINYQCMNQIDNDEQDSNDFVSEAHYMATQQNTNTSRNNRQKGTRI